MNKEDAIMYLIIILMVIIGVGGTLGMVWLSLYIFGAFFEILTKFFVEIILAIGSIFN